MIDVSGLSPLVQKYSEYCIPSKTKASEASEPFVIGKEGNITCDGIGFTDIVTKIGGSGIGCAGIVFNEEARAGLADFVDKPEFRGRRVDLRRVTIVELKI